MSEIALILLFLAGLGASIVLLKIIWQQTKRRAGLLGINFRRVDCPKCGHRTPFVRQPTSIRQALWGGWTCAECRTEIDKWAKVVKAAGIKVD